MKYQAFVRELDVWARVDHPHVVPLIGFYWDAEDDMALFISPLMEMGTLHKYLHNNSVIPLQQRINLVSTYISVPECNTNGGISQ